MGAFLIAVVPANVGLETSTTAIAVAEYLDNWTTRARTKRHAVRDVIAVRTEPVEMSQADIVSAVAEIAAPLGPEARVVVNVAGSLNARFPWLDAWRQDELALPPIPISIAGDGVGSDEQGRLRLGEAELVSALREQVKTDAFTLPPGGEGADVVRAAMAVEPGLTEGGRLRFPSRRRDGRVFALALALYPQLAPSHDGRRYRSQALPATSSRPAMASRTYESFRDARAAIGALAEG